MVRIDNNNNIENNYKNLQPNNENQKENTIISIFNEDKDKIFSIEEQKKALESNIMEFYNEFKNILDNAGLKINEFIAKAQETITKDEALDNGISTEIAEWNIKTKINNAEKELINIATAELDKENKELDKENKELLLQITCEFDISLLRYEELEKLKSIVKDYEQLMDPEDDKCLKQLNYMKQQVNNLYPNTYENL